MLPRLRTTRPVLVALPLLLALVLTACSSSDDGGDRGPSGSDDADIADAAGAVTGRWVEPKGGSIEFTSGGALTGMDGCNSFEGSWTGTKAKLRLQTKATSERRCVAAPTLPVSKEMEGALREDDDILELRTDDGTATELTRDGGDA